MHGLVSSITFFHTRIQGTRIVVTLELVFDVLRVPRVEHPNYPGCEHLQTVSKDEIIPLSASALLIGVIVNLHHVQHFLKVLDS